jgi:hypothetical protein
MKNLLARKFRFILAFTCIGVFGCTTVSTVDIQQSLEATKLRKIRIEACTDRTGYQGSRDLGGEATRSLTEKMQKSGLFEITPDAQFVLTCDIERFEEGSAAKRWLLPGWGATQAEVVVMVWGKPEDKILATFRSEAAVKAGGLYTIGADKYIFGVAFEDVLKQMKRWMSGSPSEKSVESTK